MVILVRFQEPPPDFALASPGCGAERRKYNEVQQAVQHTSDPAVAADSGQRTGSELGGRLCLGGGRLEAAFEIPDFRERGRLVLRDGAEADGRERGGRAALHSG